jgi:hypothetical protein
MSSSRNYMSFCFIATYLVIIYQRNFSIWKQAQVVVCKADIETKYDAKMCRLLNSQKKNSYKQKDFQTIAETEFQHFEKKRTQFALLKTLTKI